jgi:hypothetical protein
LEIDQGITVLAGLSSNTCHFKKQYMALLRIERISSAAAFHHKQQWFHDVSKKPTFLLINWYDLCLKSNNMF